MRLAFVPLFVLVLLTPPCRAQKIETQKPDRNRITRLETAVNHLSVIEVADAVEQVAAGSPAFKVKWRGNKVFVQPLEADAATNLFIWTRAGDRLSYELVAAGPVERMHFAIDHEAPARATVAETPPPPVQSPTVPDAGTILKESIPVATVGHSAPRKRISVLLRDVFEQDGRVYVPTPFRTAEGYLAGQGEFFAETTHNGIRTVQESASMLHSVELTDIFLRLHQAGVLVAWKWETEIRNQNGFTSVPYAKDYDAVVTVRVNSTDVQFALEYERMAKSRQRYATIRELFERERSVSTFVYLAAHYDLLSFVAGQFERARTSVCFGLFGDLMRHALDMEVVTGGSGSKASLRSFLVLR